MPRKIDLENYPRRKHFEYFRGLQNPYFGVTVNVDVTELVRLCKERRLSFYLAFMHCVALAADSVVELRQRIIDGEIWEYESCPTSHTELLEDGTYCYCTLHHHMSGEEFFEYAEKQRLAARDAASLEEDGDPTGMYFITSLPWLHYTSLIQPTGDDSNPRISWGKFEADFKGTLMLPVTLLVHHGLADGSHAAAFYRQLEKAIVRLIEEY